MRIRIRNTGRNWFRKTKNHLGLSWLSLEPVRLVPEGAGLCPELCEELVRLGQYLRALLEEVLLHRWRGEHCQRLVQSRLKNRQTDKCVTNKNLFVQGGTPHSYSSRPLLVCKNSRQVTNRALKFTHKQKDPDLLPHLLFSVFNRGAAVEDTFTNVTVPFYLHLGKMLDSKRLASHSHCHGRNFSILQKNQLYG